MRRMVLTVSLCGIMVTIFAGSNQAATFWLTNNSNGTAIPEHSGVADLYVPSGGNFTLHCFVSSEDPGIRFDALVGFDVSDKSTCDLGGNPTQNKIQLISFCCGKKVFVKLTKKSCNRSRHCFICRGDHIWSPSFSLTKSLK